MIGSLEDSGSEDEVKMDNLEEEYKFIVSNE